jgi:hypothetical protein
VDLDLLRCILACDSTRCVSTFTVSLLDQYTAEEGSSSASVWIRGVWQDRAEL